MFHQQYHYCNKKTTTTTILDMSLLPCKFQRVSTRDILIGLFVAPSWVLYVTLYCTRVCEDLLPLKCFCLFQLL